MLLKKVWAPEGCLHLPQGYIHVYDHYLQISFSLKRLSQSKPNFMWGLWKWGQIYKNGFGHMTKMAICQYMVKTPEPSPMTLKLGMQRWGHKLYKICTNDPRLTLTIILHQGQIQSSMCFFKWGNCSSRIMRKTCSK